MLFIPKYMPSVSGRTIEENRYYNVYIAKEPVNVSYYDRSGNRRL